MTVDAYLPSMRQDAEDLMTDTCVITRAGAGNGPFNETTGQYETPAATTVYAGKCRIQIASVVGDASASNAGDREGTTQGSVLQLPVLDSTMVVVNDMVTVTACVNDPSLIGSTYTVEGRHGKSQATARRLRVTEVTG